MSDKRSALGALKATAAAAILSAAAGGAHAQATAQEAPGKRVPSFNLYGLPGLVDMPTAEMASDGTLALTVGQFGNTTRGTLSFQLLPRVIGSFRYARLQDSTLDPRDDYFDRSFDIRLQLLKESDWLPAVTVGLQDFAGTGLFGGEYLVATKEIVPGLRVTGGLGWGRLGSHNVVGSTGTRPANDIGLGGTVDYERFFRGDAGFFGGVSYDVTDRLRVKLEYSSDDYELEQSTSPFERSSPWNFGIDYMFRNGTQLSLYHVYGTEIGAQITLATDLKSAPVPGGNEGAPLPVQPRSAESAVDLGWTGNSVAQTRARESLDQLLDDEGIGLEGLRLEAGRATARIQNRKYNAVPQAIGRTARAMTRALPGSISEFVIVTTEDGLPGSAVVLDRADIETLEFDAASAIEDRARIVDAAGLTPAPFPDEYPKLEWSFSPFVRTSAFDPDEPLRVDYGLRVSGEARLTPSFILAGAVSHKLGGNIGDGRINTATPGVPAVRTNYTLYAREADTAVDYLTLSHYAHPVEDFYTRVTAGYLERQYAGISTEVLWKPVDSRLGLGGEVNFIRQRDYDGGFGLRDNETITGEIPEVNGHLSAYYDIGWGFHGQVDVGRYLAGDYGATVSIDREFDNGWRVGAFATFTELSADEFGEGSFDKGIRVTLPLNWAIGSANRRAETVVIKPITRDGGARLSVRGRLYDRVRDNHGPEMAKTWGRFWR
ncbi:YjbH domain-containing protein [Roseivivax isoporae]|uniref:Exopolysaccharide biosynthesis protein YbjH n=1 Tax=Roseivivax isoporae LMG 25204 TaxID=1449351 RepID=X7F9U7_9RHOB|nr:YjbH domain-containing protein [Roseivivax isoporae]ETX29677.1 hypothetical protein RISW2_22600 [Roseivivax isoporae LMG 25204]